MISAARLAWLQLRRQKIRLAVALAGVGFAVVLMTMQLGFRDALFASAVGLHQRLDGELFLIHPHHSFLALPRAIPRSRLYQALAFPGVEAVSPIYTGLGPFKHPVTGESRSIFVLGIDPAAHVLAMPAVDAHRDELRYPDVVFYDEQSRPEFGPVAELVRAGEKVETEIGPRRVEVRRLFPLGTSFGIDGTVITSDLNFLRIFPQHTAGTITFGLIRLAPGADLRAVHDGLAAWLPRDVQVMTKAEFVAREIHHWATATPIGFVFTFGVIMGITVGSIIVYQILFADISDHLAEYATLKAMGYTNRYLAGVVLAEALILAVVGFLPALGVAAWLYRVTASATNLPMRLAPDRAALVLALTVLMCCVSGLLAMRKLRGADPAEVF